jgi:hypothetical protein
MLVMVGFGSILALLLLAPSIVGGAVFLGLESSVGWWAVVPAGIGALAVTALEARLLLSRLGRVFEATDPASVPPVEAR